MCSTRQINRRDYGHIKEHIYKGQHQQNACVSPRMELV